jgi:uncharacterized protein DUF6627
MNTALKKTTCRVLVVSLLALSFQTAKAGLIGADQAAAGTTSTERAMLLSTLDRGDVTAQLQAAGIDPLAARERVNSMTDQEVRAMAQDMQAAPAGGLSTWGWVGVVAVVALVWYFLIRK